MDKTNIIPDKERWFFENKERVKSFEKSMKQSKEGKVKSIGSFAKFVANESGGTEGI